MEYINGGCLGDILLSNRLGCRFTLKELQAITRKLGLALKKFKDMDVAHRDLHNGQIMIRFRNLGNIQDFKKL